MNVVALLMMVAAAIVWLVPDAPVAPSSAPARTEQSGTLAVGAPASLAADSLIATIVNGNMFSATRRAPTTRFVVPGSGASVVSEAPMGAAVVPMTGADSSGQAGQSAEAESMPRLSGIVALNGEWRALLQLSSADGGATLYRVGDEHAGYRIARILADRVELRSAAGTRTLYLTSPVRSAPSRGKPDSSEVSRE